MRCALIGVLLFVSSACAAPDIASEPWRSSQQKALNAAADLPAQAQHLLEKILPNADVVPPAVGDARFVDLDRDGSLELVATVDYSGRGFFDNVVVVRRQQGHFDWTAVASNGPSIEHLDAHLSDVDGDDVPELVLERFMDRYEGALRVPVETVVYRWEPTGFVDASDTFPQYYRVNVIPGLEEQVARAASNGSSKGTSSAEGEGDELSMPKIELARARQRGRTR